MGHQLDNQLAHRSGLDVVQNFLEPINFQKISHNRRRSFCQKWAKNFTHISCKGIIHFPLIVGKQLPSQWLYFLNHDFYLFFHLFLCLNFWRGFDC